MNLVSFKSEQEYDHVWFPDLQLEQINTPNGRFYLTPEGNKYRSVTTFLGQSDPDSQAAIEAWRNSIGRAEADMVSKRATTRGSTLHEHIEEYLLNHTVDIPKNRLLDVQLFKSVLPALNRISNIRLLENRLYSDTLKLAGTVDCVGCWDGELAVIDFKTSGYKKSIEEIESYWLQTSIYSLMVEERFGLKIDKLVVLMGVEFEKPIIFESSRKKWLPKLAKLIKEFNSDF